MQVFRELNYSIHSDTWRAPIAATVLGGLMVLTFNFVSCFILIRCVAGRRSKAALCLQGHRQLLHSAHPALPPNLPKQEVHQPERAWLWLRLHHGVVLRHVLLPAAVRPGDVGLLPDRTG